MKHLFSIVATLLLLAAPAAAQTIKSLGYNATNGQIVAATNTVWTNSFSFSSNTVAAQVRTNLSLGWSALTNTNTANALIGYNTTNNIVVQPSALAPFDFGALGIRANVAEFGSASGTIGFNTNGRLIFYTTNSGFSFGAGASATQLRSDLGLGSGITTNRTFVSYNGTNYTTNSVSISNGIITGWTQ